MFTLSIPTDPRVLMAGYSINEHFSKSKCAIILLLFKKVDKSMLQGTKKAFSAIQSLQSTDKATWIWKTWNKFLAHPSIILARRNMMSFLLRAVCIHRTFIHSFSQSLAFFLSFFPRVIVFNNKIYKIFWQLGYSLLYF